MYLEPLPASLDHGPMVEFSEGDISRILLDVSSALVYLKTIPIVHNDIKPRNITYHPRRGAVLIDFGLATSASEWNAGGTSWYLPPDLLDYNTRGFPGDIWALGITALYLFGKIICPENDPDWKNGWIMRNLIRNVKEQEKMRSWLQHISSVRAKLCPVYRGTGMSRLESTVWNMLEPDSDLRFNAEEVVSALDH